MYVPRLFLQNCLTKNLAVYRAKTRFHQGLQRIRQITSQVLFKAVQYAAYRRDGGYNLSNSSPI
ncbi:hypothetical protein CGG78_01355 [Vibrio parahaemolyticus]|nr:hypothetical protein CTT36_05815 [Vibrio parahaemolyticus]TOE40805.1 hypothetical protein CGJ43_10185 [Vibrio parahaemolyticus]TOL57586.1 hypothetical protein CGH98_01285 [Vibrio parahaemolyticus]TOO07687.1 hypothetical protein CGH45_00315 [Vibrio parahaemolyticus]TOR30464.1 hypothetical protein CGG78_01355 [Vibrio parahaemolyticus]